MSVSAKNDPSGMLLFSSMQMEGDPQGFDWYEDHWDLGPNGRAIGLLEPIAKPHWPVIDRRWPDYLD